MCPWRAIRAMVLTHNYILKEVWGSALASDMASLRVFMATLRKKIEFDPSHPRYVQTHVGIGYRMMKVDADEGFEDCVKTPASDIGASRVALTDRESCGHEVRERGRARQRKTPGA